MKYASRHAATMNGNAKPSSRSLALSATLDLMRILVPSKAASNASLGTAELIQTEGERVQILVACRRDFVTISEEPDIRSNRPIPLAAPFLNRDGYGAV